MFFPSFPAWLQSQFFHLRYPKKFFFTIIIPDTRIIYASFDYVPKSWTIVILPSIHIFTKDEVKAKSLTCYLFELYVSLEHDWKDSLPQYQWEEMRKEKAGKRGLP